MFCCISSIWDSQRKRDFMQALNNNYFQKMSKKDLEDRNIQKLVTKKLNEMKRAGAKVGGKMKRTGAAQINKIKKMPKKKKKWILKVFLVICAVGVLSVAGVFLYYAKDLPDPGKINKRLVAESTKIYDRTGDQLLYEIHGDEKRTIISAEEIPDSVKYATIVLEDQGFYHHHGIDFQGILRAAIKDAIHIGVAEGGSTITQQFIKNSILTSEKRISRKIKEAVLAVEMEQKFTKDQILQMYLNEIPYGSNVYGIEAAAQTFFGVPARDLTLAQSALLASLPQATTYYSPHGSHTDRLLVRWKYALGEMRKLGYINDQQYEEAVNQDVLGQVVPYKNNIKAPHFVLYVKEQLVEEFGEEEVEKGGFNVYTTLNWDMQQLAEKVVKEGVEENGDKYNFSNAALVALNPKNGQILSMVGSKDYFDESIDGNVNVAIRMRQPGSSFKPYVYAEAFRKGYTPDTTIFDVDTDFETDDGKEYNPKNYDNQNHGPLKMKKALGMSLNVPAVKTLYLAGVKDAVELARSMGITTLEKPSRYGLALVLGGGEVKLVDHVAAFSVFANAGKKNEKTSILRVEDADGEVIKNFENKEEKEVLEKNVALQICDILSDNKNRQAVFGTNNNLVIPGKQVAAKTGTTNEWRDGWLVGSSPSLAAGVWTGNNDNTPMAQGADGSYTAGPIWNKFMTEALKNKQPEEFEKPMSMEELIEKEVSEGAVMKPILDGSFKVEEKIEVCKKSNGDYCLASSDCPDSLKENKHFFNAHNILYYVNREDPLGEYPEDSGDDPQYKNWEKAVQKWADKKADDENLKIAPEDKCDGNDFDDFYSEIKITDPDNGDVIKNKTIKIETDISGDADVDQVDFFFDGDSIGSKKDGPYEKEYNIPDSKNGQTVVIKVKVYDKDGGKDEDSIRVKIEF